MLRCFINRRVVNGPWGGGAKWVEAMNIHAGAAGFSIVPNPKDADIVVVAGLSPEDGMPGVQELMWHPKKLLRVNECDRRKNTQGLDSYIRQISSQCQATVFVSNWLREEIEPGSKHPIVYNGCDTEMFKPELMGYSTQNYKTNIVVHHWSNNIMKGADYYEALRTFCLVNPDFTFTYIGRTGLQSLEIDKPGRMPGRLGKSNSRLIEPLWGAALAQELSMYDVVINASRWDPAPNSILESISCGLPTYAHVNGGGGREIAGEDHVFNSFEEVSYLLLNKQFKKNSFPVSDWLACVKQYAEVMKSL